LSIKIHFVITMTWVLGLFFLLFLSKHNGYMFGVTTVMFFALIIYIYYYTGVERKKLKIQKFLIESPTSKDDMYRSSASISSATGIPIDKVRKYCTQSKWIVRSQTVTDSWRFHT